MPLGRIGGLLVVAGAPIPTGSSGISTAAAIVTWPGSRHTHTRTSDDLG